MYIHIYIYILQGSSVKLGNDTEQISMAPAQGRHAYIEKCKANSRKFALAERRSRLRGAPQITYNKL